MNRRPLSVDLGLLEPLDSLSEPMANTARKITAESLHARLPVENPHDEFGRLADQRMVGHLHTWELRAEARIGRSHRRVNSRLVGPSIDR